MPHAILAPLKACTALTKTEDARAVIRDLSDALGAYPSDSSCLSSGIQESLCAIITQLLDENIRTAYHPILTLLLEVVNAGPASAPLEKVLAKAFVEPVTVSKKAESEDKALELISLLLRIIDAGLRQTAFGTASSGSALCFLLSLYNNPSISAIPISIRTKAEERIISLIRLNLSPSVKQKILRPLMEDCVFCLLSTTSVLKILREPVENIDTILWLTALVIEQTIQYEMEIDAAVFTALKTRIGNLTASDITICQRMELQKERAEDFLDQLQSVAIAAELLGSTRTAGIFQFLYVFLPSLVTNKDLYLGKSTHLALSLLVNIYSLTVFVHIGVLLLKVNPLGAALLTSLLANPEADLSGRFAVSSPSATEKAALPLLKGRCLVTYITSLLTHEILSLVISDLSDSVRSGAVSVLEPILTVDYNLMLGNTSLRSDYAIKLAKKDAVVASLTPELSSSQKVGISNSLTFYKVLFALTSTKDVKQLLKPSSTLVLYMYFCSHTSWKLIIDFITAQTPLLVKLSPQGIQAIILTYYYRISHEFCAALVSNKPIPDIVKGAAFTQLIGQLESFVRLLVSIPITSDAEKLKALIRTIAAFPTMLYMLFIAPDTTQDHRQLMQDALHCDALSLAQAAKSSETSVPFPSLVTDSEKNCGVLILPQSFQGTGVEEKVTELCSLLKPFTEMSLLLLDSVHEWGSHEDMTPLVSTLLTSLIGVHLLRPAVSGIYSLIYPEPPGTQVQTHANDRIYVMFIAINATLLEVMGICARFASGNETLSAPLFAPLGEKALSLMLANRTILKRYLSVGLKLQSTVLCSIFNNPTLQKRLTEDVSIRTICDILDAQLFKGETAAKEDSGFIATEYGLLLGARSVVLIDDFSFATAEQRNQVIEAMIDQSAFTATDILNTFPDTVREIHLLFSFLASKESLIFELGNLCAALSTEYYLFLKSFSRHTELHTKDKLVFIMFLITLILSYIPLLCQDKALNTHLIEIYQYNTGMMAFLLQWHYFVADNAAKDSSDERFLYLLLVTLHRSFDLLDSKLIDAPGYTDVYKSVISFLQEASSEYFAKVWCFTLFRLLRLCSTPVAAIRLQTFSLICTVIEKSAPVCSFGNLFILLRDILFKSMAMVVMCVPSGAYKTRTATAASVVSCQQVFFNCCDKIICNVPLPIKVRVLHALVLTMHSSSMAASMSACGEVLRLIHVGLEGEMGTGTCVEVKDKIALFASELTLENVFSDVLAYPLMSSIFPGTLHATIDHSPWMATLTVPDSFSDEGVGKSLADLVDELVSLLMTDTWVKFTSSSEAAISPTSALEDLCSTGLTLLSRLPANFEAVCKLLVRSATLLNLAASTGEPNQSTIDVLASIPTHIFQYLASSSHAIPTEYSLLESCFKLILTYLLLNEEAFLRAISCMMKILPVIANIPNRNQLYRLLSVGLSRMFVDACNTSTFTTKTLSINLSAVITWCVQLFAAGQTDIAEAMTLANVVSSTVTCTARPQLQAILMLAICDTYKYMRTVVSDDTLFLVLSHFLPLSDHSASNSSSLGSERSSTVISADVLVYGDLDTGSITTLCASLLKNNEDTQESLERCSCLYRYDPAAPAVTVTVDIATLYQLILNTTLHALSLYTGSIGTLRKCITLIKNVLKSVEYTKMHLYAIPPSEKAHKYLSVFLSYIFTLTLAPETATAILPPNSMPLVYYNNMPEKSVCIKPHLFAIQDPLFHFFKVCRDLPLSRQVEQAYLSALTQEMGLCCKPS